MISLAVLLTSFAAVPFNVLSTYTKAVTTHFLLSGSRTILQKRQTCVTDAKPDYYTNDYYLFHSAVVQWLQHE